eukprot:4329100-Amphidinium_carterae.1
MGERCSPSGSSPVREGRLSAGGGPAFLSRLLGKYVELALLDVEVLVELLVGLVVVQVPLYIVSGVDALLPCERT